MRRPDGSRCEEPTLTRNPKLSIGIPVYNGERYLSEAIDALLEQSFGDFELLISDNASTDATEQIARAAVSRDPRVAYFRNAKNLGAAANFTAVFRRATAPYFKWACADDRMAPGFLDAALRELDAHPEAVACYGQVTLIDAEGREIGHFEQGLDLRSPDVRERFRRARAHMGLLNVLQGVMRTQAVARCAPQGAYQGSDEVLVTELSLQGRIHEVSAPMLFRRMHPRAMSAAKGFEQKLAHLDPGKRFSTYYWSHSIESLRAIARAPLAAHTKLQLAAGELRAMITLRYQLLRELRDAAGQLRPRI